jgi:hypothetical protein
MRDRTKNVARWALHIASAAAFLMAGPGELFGFPKMEETFDRIGMGQWSQYVAEGIKVGATILLLIPSVAPLGAAILICTMPGTVRSHLFLVGGSPFPAFVLLCFNAIVVGVQFGGLKAWIGRSAARSIQAGNTISRPVARPVNRPSRKLVNVIST